MVFGNNTTSDISKLSKILKYYEPVLLSNTTCRSRYYLFIIEAEKFSVRHKRPFILRLKKANTGVYVRNNLLTSMEEMIDSFFVKRVQTIRGKQHSAVARGGAGGARAPPVFFLKSKNRPV